METASYRERGGGLYGYWIESRPIVTRILEVECMASSPRLFSFRADLVPPDDLLGFWHIHSILFFHGLRDLRAYWQLRNLFRTHLIFVVFVRQDFSFHVLHWRPDSLLPSIIRRSSIVLPDDWKKILFADRQLAEEQHSLANFKQEK